MKIYYQNYNMMKWETMKKALTAILLIIILTMVFVFGCGKTENKGNSKAL